MANVKQQLEIPAIPSLGSSGIVYSQNLQNQNNNLLRLFFIKLLGIMSSLVGPNGGSFINTPHGAFQDSTNQTAANTTTAYAITFNTTDFSNYVTLSNSSHLNVQNSGIYNIQFSIQFTNNTNATQDVEVWFRKNGTDIDKSNSRFGLAPRKSAGDPYHVISAMNFFVSLEKNDYVELMWRPTDTGISIEKYAAGTTPTRPETPSVIATISFVSNLPT